MIRKTKKPKRASLPKDKPAGNIDLDTALALLSLPRDVGPHLETGDMIQVGYRYGPYLKYQGSFTSLPADDDLLTVGLNRAVDLLAGSAKKKGRLLGEHPSGGEVHLKAGRFGPYVEHNKLSRNAAARHRNVRADTRGRHGASSGESGQTYHQEKPEKAASKKARAKAAAKTGAKKSATKAAKKAAP